MIITFIIESPGKIDTIRRLALSSLYTSKIRVVATNGHLFDLPKKTVGVKYTAHNVSADYVIINPRVMQKIENATRDADHVIIATDNDVEGEVIADEVAQHIQHKKTDRMRLTNLNQESFDAAYNSLSTIDDNLVFEGKARRLLDRLIGYQLTTNINQSAAFPIGRVKSPVLACIKDNPTRFSSGEIQLVNKDKVVLITLAHNITSDRFKAIKRIVTALEFPIVESSHERVTLAQYTPWSYPDFLKASMKELDITISEAAKCAQELYEDGKISYPRTESKSISASEEKRLNELRQRFGLKTETHKRISAEPHSAILPLTDDIHFSVPQNALHINDRALQLIASNLLHEGDTTAYKCTLLPACETYNSWKTAELMPEIASVQYFQYIKHSTIPLSPVKSHWVSNEEKVLDTMIECNIARPSTYASISTEVAKKYLNNFGQINARGELCLEYAQSISSEILNYHLGHEIKKSLKQKGQTISDRVNKALQTLSIKVDFDKNRDIILDWDII